MLKVMRARSFEEFRSAFASFGVPGQNMLYADAEGNIGQVLAVQIPDRRSAPEDLIVNASKRTKLGEHCGMRPASPVAMNPGKASSRRRTINPRMATPPSAGFSRRRTECGAWRRWSRTTARSTEQVMAMQRDVYVGSSATLNRVLVRKMREAGVAAEAQAMRAGFRARRLGTANIERMRRDRSPSSCSAPFTQEFYGPRSAKATSRHSPASVVSRRSWSRTSSGNAGKARTGAPPEPRRCVGEDRRVCDLGRHAPSVAAPPARLPAADRPPFRVRRLSDRRQHRSLMKTAHSSTEGGIAPAMAPTRATSPISRTWTAIGSWCSAARTAG